MSFYSPFLAQLTPDKTDYIGKCDFAAFGILSALIFHGTAIQAPIADDDAMWDAYQFHIRKHEPGADFSVVQQHFNPGSQQVPIDFFHRIDHRSDLCIFIGQIAT